ncbi:MAG: ABC transporter ATP-binding protein [Chloroflexi bacterium]|nr:ABC transporter ATP-binding protein [Chloroflexota bacterium]
MRFTIRLLTLLRGRERLLAIAIGAALAHVVLGLAPALLIRQVLVELTVTGTLAAASIAVCAAGIALVALVRAGCLYLDSFFHHVAAYGMLADLRVQLFDHLQRLSHRYFNRRQTGALTNTVINDVDTIELFVAHALSQFAIGLFVPLGVTLVLLALNWRLGLLAIVMAPVVALLLLGLTPRLRAHWRSVRAQLSELNAYIQDSLAGISVVKAFGAESARRAEVAARSAAFERAITRALATGTWSTALIEGAAGLATALVIATGAGMVVQGQLLMADLFVFLVYLALLYRPLIDLSHANEGLQAAMAASERVFAALDETPEVADRPAIAAPLPPHYWSLAFEAVDFAYEPGRPVLHGVRFCVEPGQVVALVGPSGAGKSTLAALVQRWYDVDAGAVRLAGHDVRDVPLAWLRAQVSAVLQDVFLFHGTVRDNLLVARPAATAAELDAAIAAANATDFITDLPDGLDTVIGERGVRLSGGQKQRLSIARALLKNAPVLVLDEATSSVDVETEALIQAALDRLVRHRTTLVIAHRLSTIRHADQIVVLDAGGVVQAGTHAELIAQPGLYASLYRAQEVSGAWEISGRSPVANRQ